MGVDRKVIDTPMSEKNDEICSAYQDKIYIYFKKYFGIILTFGCTAILLIGVLDGRGSGYLIRIIHITIVFAAIGFIVERFMRKIAGKIIINFKNKKITFFMCRNDNIKEYDFSSIKSIHMKRYAKFNFEEEKIIYNIVGNHILQQAIRRIKNSENGDNI